MRYLPIVLTSFFLYLHPLSAQVYVDANAGGANNGSSWANAYTDLQTALTNTPNGEIWVANGTYKPTICNPCLLADRLISFNLPPGVQLYGGFAGNETSLDQRDWTTNFSILSGDIGTAIDSTDNTFRVMAIENSLSTTRLDGFIIEEGNADGSSLNGGLFSGGGIYLDANPGGTGHARIHNCNIRNNFAGGGGGMTIDAVIGGVIEADIRNCIFDNNRASTGNVSSTGGAILMLGNSGAQIMPTIVGCTFQNNYVGNDGAAISMTPSGATSFLGTTIDSCTFINNESSDRGGAIWYRMIQGTSTVNIKNSTFLNNVSGGEGGAIFARSSFDAVSNDTIVNCLFTQNSATGTSSINIGNGGGIYLRGSQDATRNHTVLNCVFDRNYASHNGGAIGTISLFLGTNPTGPGIINTNLVNCSFFGNQADSLGGAFHAEQELGTNNTTISNSIFWNDLATFGGNEFASNNAFVLVSDSDVDGGIPAGIVDAGNNLDVDPSFIDSSNGDLRIGNGSPLINAGNNDSVLPMQDPDPDGDIRIWDGTVDMGAYEVGVIYVDDSASGANNGSSWTDAYTELQDGINRAYGGDQIWVADGSYYPTSCSPCLLADRLISFNLKSGTELYGGFNGTETALSQRNWNTNFSILSGDIGTAIDSTDNTFRVVSAENTTSKTIFDGLIVEEGNADGSSLNGGLFSGGGMYIDANPGGIGNLKIRNVTFRNNFAGGGGAMTIDAVIGGSIEAEIRDCIFENNRASTGNVSSTGGAILMLGNSGAQIMPTIVGCTFQNNYVGNDGAAISMTPSGATSFLGTTIDSCTFINNESSDRGGAIWYRIIQASSAVNIRNSSFMNNTSGGQGGAIYARASFDAVANDTIVNCIFTQNSATGTSSNNNGNGGAILLRGSQDATRNHAVLNCVFDRNYASHNGGAIGTISLFLGTNPTGPGIINTNLVNCSFHANEADSLGGALHADQTLGINNVTISNSILSNDAAPFGGDELASNLASVTVSYCHVEGGIPAGITDGGNNLDTNPNFIDPFNGNLRLGPCSPLINIGDNLAVLAIQNPDMDGNDRTVNGIVDFGAYEFASTPPTSPMINTIDQTLCPGTPVSLEANDPAAGESGSWTVISGTGTFSPSAADTNPTVTGLSDGTNVFAWDISNAFCDYDPVEVSIEIVDQGPPTAICQDVTIGIDYTEIITIQPEVVDNGSFDDCPDITYNISMDTFDISNYGPNPVILSIEDGSGNLATCPAIVTIESNCTGDFNIDGIISVADLLLLISQFGCSLNCPFDISGDDAVSTQDLLIMLSLFGTPCP